MGYATLSPAWHGSFGIPGEEYFTPDKVDGWTVIQPSSDDDSPVPDNSWTYAFQALDDQQLSITFSDDETLNYDPVLDIELRDTVNETGYTEELKFTQEVYTVDEAAEGINIQLSPEGEYNSTTVIIVDNDHPLHNDDLTPPPNDNFADRIVLSGSQIATTGFNTMASSEQGEPDHNGSDTWGASVWWSWTAPESGLVVIDTLGSTFSTDIGIYTGSSVSNLLPVSALGIDTSTTYREEVFADTEQVLFEAVAGTTYHIAVDGQDEFSRSEAEWGLSGYVELDIVQEQPNLTIIPQGSGTSVISDFGGVGTSVNPSDEVISQVDTLKFFDDSAGLTAANMLLTQQEDDLVISFEFSPNTEVVLENFALENLDNHSTENGASATVGNILFVGDKTIQDSFDVINADQNITEVSRENTVTFLNDLDNQTSGLENSDDALNGQGGNDILSGLSGNDKLRGGAGNDSLDGGQGGDTLRGGAGIDTLNGGADNDSLNGEEGDDSLYGGEGNDYIDGWTGDDYYLSGEAGDDTILGYDGDDRLSGDAGNDYLYGEEGNDYLYGKEDNDSLSGGEGNDSLSGDAGNDSLSGGEGNDSLSGGEGNDYIDGWTGYDTLYGNLGDDTLLGYDGYDSLLGGDGSDSLLGGASDDILDGRAGNDTLNGFGGGTEFDTLSGGDGPDIFVLGDASATYYQELGYAAINDFDRTEGDKIQVFGSESDYTLDPFESLGVVDIYYLGERIGAVNNTTDVIISQDFIFV